jgi:hypothetical protein
MSVLVQTSLAKDIMAFSNIIVNNSLTAFGEALSANFSFD